MTEVGDVQMLGEGLSEGSAWNQFLGWVAQSPLGHLSWGSEVGQLSVELAGNLVLAFCATALCS